MIKCEFEDGFQGKFRHVTVDCLVVKDSRILLVKRSQKLTIEAGKWCLPGGYMERDETTVQGGKREALEETGWSIDNLRLFRVNDDPNRPAEDRQNIDFVYLADPIEQVQEKDWESEEVRWFALDDLPPKDQLAFDHADNIELYKKYLKETFPVPVIGS